MDIIAQLFPAKNPTDGAPMTAVLASPATPLRTLIMVSLAPGLVIENLSRAELI
jgi:hypothetical protein